MHKKLFFIFCFIYSSQTVFANDMCPQNSQAIDLLEYDLARLEIAKQDVQRKIDSVFLSTAIGMSFCLFAYYCGISCGKYVEESKHTYEFRPALLVLSTGYGAMIGGMIGIISMMRPWMSALKKKKIERKIEQINERISLLQRK